MQTVESLLAVAIKLPKRQTSQHHKNHKNLKRDFNALAVRTDVHGQDDVGVLGEEFTVTGSRVEEPQLAPRVNKARRKQQNQREHAHAPSWRQRPTDCH
jgi:hypothetical protein